MGVGVQLGRSGIYVTRRAGSIIRWTAACIFVLVTLGFFFIERYVATIFSALCLYFILYFVLRAHTDPFPLAMRVIQALVMLLGTIFITSLPWLLFGGWEACEERRGTSKTPWDQSFEDHQMEFTFRVIFLWFIAAFTIYITLGEHSPSAHARQACRCVPFLWFGKLIHVIPSVIDSCQVPEYDEDGLRPNSVVALLTTYGNSVHFITDVWFLQLVVSKLMALQAAYGEVLPRSCIIAWLARILIFFVIIQGFGAISRWTALINSIVLSVGVSLLSICLCKAYAVPYKYLAAAQKVAATDAVSEEMRKETTFAMRIIWRSQVGIILGTTGMVLAFIALGLEFYSVPRNKTWSMVYVVGSNLDSLSVACSLVMLSGVHLNFSACRTECCSGKSKLSSTGFFASTSSSRGSKSWPITVGGPDGEDEWHQKVANLAMRRVSAKMLLDFYLQLGQEAMPHFDPKISTTNDVVRHVVIPRSRDGDVGLSFAEKFKPAKVSREPRMVTHHWSNRFADLIASVLADALGLKRWDLMAERLRAGQGEDLREQLYAHGSLHWQYWICAFCINQHASICGSSMGVLDTVTQEVLPCCDCATPKYLNDQPIRCEMNKFDDMMAYLHLECPHFLQVVAIDTHFMIFSRAWCVAELVQADASHLEQHMMIHSPGALEKNSGQLKSIRVEECSASREEDKAAILAKIGGKEDVEKFNQRLQQILLGNEGLLADWLDGQKLLQEVGSIAARAKARVEAASVEEADKPLPEV
eukprot:symbB.v1.2.018759.t1/scaffold1510.1/size114631/3